MHDNSKILFERYAKKYFEKNMDVLEIGPDCFPSSYQHIVSRAGCKWNTIDAFERKGLTYLAKGEYDFGLPSNSFDIVLSGQVIEHVRRTWDWMAECGRVCKPGGYVITINPVSWGYHEAPIDCWRIYPEGMRSLYEQAGLIDINSFCETNKINRASYAFMLTKQLLKIFLGRNPNVIQPETDTITIGMKRSD